MEVVVAKNEEELIKNVSTYLKNIFTEWSKNEKKSKYFVLGLSGGSQVKIVTSVFSSEEWAETDWSSWKIIFCDERLVEFKDKDSSYGAYKKDLISAVPKCADSFLAVNESIIGDPITCAEDYETRLKHVCERRGNDYVANVLLLGMGPDGHTCSLFPGHRLLQKQNTLVAPITDSPKPPNRRITLTLSFLNSASNIAFITTGEGKASTIKDIFNGNPNKLPAGMVAPKAGKVTWILDEPAAKEVKAN